MMRGPQLLSAATPGVSASDTLVQEFTSAMESGSVRFLKIAIRKDHLEHESSVPVTGTLEEDLQQLPGLVEEDHPAYILVRLDDPQTEWLAIAYVPDTAKVREKMLYASSRSSLTKSLGATHFSDSLLATCKADLTPAAYASHKASRAAPKPLSARERELAELQSAERETAAGAAAGGHGAAAPFRRGSSGVARINHAGSGMGLKLSEDVLNALKALAEPGTDAGKLLVMSVDLASETVNLASEKEASPEELGSLLPSSEPSYSFFSWSHTPERRETVFIYSCPTPSPIKAKMVYSSGCLLFFRAAQTQLSSVEGALKKIETSDPKEIDEKYLVSALGLDATDEAGGDEAEKAPEEKKSFARPKGPGRK